MERESGQMDRLSVAQGLMWPGGWAVVEGSPPLVWDGHILLVSHKH